MYDFKEIQRSPRWFTKNQSKNVDKISKSTVGQAGRMALPLKGTSYLEN